MATTVFKMSGTLGKTVWIKYVLIADGKVTIAEFLPALITGWNLRGVTEQGEADWPGMNAAEIAGYITRNWANIEPVGVEEIARVEHSLARRAAG